MKVLVETSARHIHLTEEHIEALYGKGAALTKKKDLSQPGQYARTLGIQAPVRESGDLAGTPGCKLVGPCGEVDLETGVIVAKRHIHMTPEDAEAAGVKDKEIVSVKIDSERSALLGDVVIRVSPKFATAMHIDTDEANATCAFGQCYGEIVK